MWPFTSSKPRPSAAAPRRRHTFRPILETLENRITPAYVISPLVSFDAANQSGVSGVIMDTSGNLYSSTSTGGAYGEGSIFEIAKGSSTITTLASFNGSNGSGQIWMIMDSSGNLYGIAGHGGIGFTGGSTGDGTVFELASGSGTITDLAFFNGSNGRFPVGRLTMDGSGNLYGATAWGGANTNSSYFPNGAGTVFEVANGSGTITTLASFNGSNGYRPNAGPIMDSSGNLYGTAMNGGADFGSTNLDHGTVYELANGSGTITALVSFNGANGLFPESPLVMDSSGNLYGPIGRVGANNYGAVFEVAAGSGTFTIVASSNVYRPIGGLIMDSSGNLYGTTQYGGSVNDGSVFELAKGSNTITPLASFNGSNGATPSGGGLIMDGNGNLYGTTYYGGAHNDGTIFEVTNVPSFAITGPSSVTAGTAGSFTVTALNANGTVNTTYTGTIHFTSSDSHAELPANYTFTAADAGVHTFSATLKTAGSQSLTATDTVTGTITGSEAGIVVNPAAAAQFILSAPSSVTHGVAFSLTLTVEDAYGNVVTGYVGTVHFTSSDSNATLPANYTFTAADAGVHTFTNQTTLRRRGTKTITVTDTLNSALTATDSINVV